MVFRGGVNGARYRRDRTRGITPAGKGQSRPTRDFCNNADVNLKSLWPPPLVGLSNVLRDKLADTNPNTAGKPLKILTNVK
jgi:hypothetical protein